MGTHWVAGSHSMNPWRVFKGRFSEEGTIYGRLKKKSCLLLLLLFKV